MEPRLTGINRNEALSYLGYKGCIIPDGIREDIFQCERMLLNTALPRLVWRQFELLEDGSLSGTDFRPEGNDIRELLKDCHHIIMMGATLGAEIEALMRRTQITNMAYAVILDACASAAIENVCDNFCEDLAVTLAPLHLTDRFSPGYGDFPFSQQPDFSRILDLPRRIGVTFSSGGLMIPQKSVTALIGVSSSPQKRRFRGCTYCNMFNTCIYRKDGRSCGAF